MSNKTFNDYFDIEMKLIDNDNIELRLKCQDSYMNQIGAIHGGVIMTLADNCSGYLANTEYVAPTLSMTTHFLRAITNTKYIYARGKILKRGKRVITVDCEVYGDDEKIAATTRTEFAPIAKRESKEIEKITSSFKKY